MKHSSNNNVQSFFDLKAWQIGHDLVIQIYKVTKNFPKEELFGIVSQLRRAASSITANIAEGFARYHFKDKTRFYYQARGSVVEVQNFPTLAKDLQYLDTDSYKDLISRTDRVARLINGMIRSIERQQKKNVSTNYGLRVTSYEK